MTPDQKKARAEALLNELRKRRASHEITTLREYLAILLESGKMALLTCDREDDFRRLQGQAAAYDRLISLIDRDPVNINPKTV